MGLSMLSKEKIYTPDILCPLIYLLKKIICQLVIALQKFIKSALIINLKKLVQRDMRISDYRVITFLHSTHVSILLSYYFSCNYYFIL